MATRHSHGRGISRLVGFAPHRPTPLRMPVDIVGLTTLNGLIAQLTALIVIVVAFALLGRITPLDGVVPVWATAWTAALIAITAIFLRYLYLPALDPGELGSSSQVSTVLDFLYQGGKLIYAGFLLLGALMLRGIRPERQVVWAGTAVLLGYAAITTAITSDPLALVRWQIGAMVPLLAGTALVLTPGVGPGHDRLAGTRPAALVAAGLAFLWLIYMFPFGGIVPAWPFGHQLRSVGRVNSYLDMLGHLVLAFALVHVASRGMQDRLVVLHRALEDAHDRLQRVARYDELTGVYNRRAFEELALDRGWGEARRLGVAMLDMDNLKDINDERGHAAGDAALAHLAVHLSASLEDAVVFRWGGDEFLCVSTSSDAPALRDRIESALGDIVAVPGLSGMRIEVSVGSAERKPDEALSSTIGRADRAMYREKFRKREGPEEQGSLWNERE